MIFSPGQRYGLRFKGNGVLRFNGYQNTTISTLKPAQRIKPLNPAYRQAGSVAD
jgi:hypothetical protein